MVALVPLFVILVVLLIATLQILNELVCQIIILKDRIQWLVLALGHLADQLAGQTTHLRQHLAQLFPARSQILRRLEGTAYHSIPHPHPPDVHGQRVIVATDVLVEALADLRAEDIAALHRNIHALC